MDATTSSIDMKNGLSIMNKGVINKKAIKEIAGDVGLFWVMNAPNKKSIDIDR